MHEPKPVLNTEFHKLWLSIEILDLFLRKTV